MKKILYSFIVIALLLGNNFAWGQETSFAILKQNGYKSINLKKFSTTWEYAETKEFSSLSYDTWNKQNIFYIAFPTAWSDDPRGKIASVSLKDGQKNWETRVTGLIWGSSITSDELNVYTWIFDSNDKKNYIVALDANSGKEIWRVHVPINTLERNVGKMKVYNGVLYFASFVNGYAFLNALKISSGQIIWSKEIYNRTDDIQFNSNNIILITSPSVYGSKYSDIDWYARAILLDYNGNEVEIIKNLWKFVYDGDDEVGIVTEDKIFFRGSRYVAAYDIKTKKEVWRATDNEEFLLGGLRLSLVSNSLLVLSDCCDLYSFDSQTGNNKFKKTFEIKNSYNSPFFTFEHYFVSPSGIFDIQKNGELIGLNNDKLYGLKGIYSLSSPTPTLTLSATTQNALATASTTNITLNTNNNWTASSNSIWLKVSPTSGNAGTNLTVNFTIDANTTATARTGIVTFTAGGLTQTYTVTQTGVIAPVLTLSATAQNVVATANVTGSSITLTANNTWSASSSVSWLKVNPTTGNAGTNLAVNFPIEANTATTVRMGVVTFTSGKLTQTYTVTQAGTVAPTLTLSVSAQNVSATTSTTNLTLTTNNSWTTTNNATWIKVSPSSGNAGTNLAVGFTIEANNGTSERVGTITFSAGGLTKTYTITQAGTITPSLILSVSAQSVSANASTTNLLLTANNNWTASSNVTWLKVSPTSGNATSTNLTVNFTIDANNNTVARVGIVTFTANGLTKTYTVTQAATVSPQLSISTTAQNVVATANTTSLTLTSNNSRTANSNVSWLKVSPSSGNNGTNLTISFTIEANTSTTIRTGIVTFTAGGLTQTCTVTQAGASTLTFTFLQPLGNQQVLPKSILAIKATGEWANEISFSVGIYEKGTSKLIQQLSTNTSTQQLKDGTNYTLNDLAPAQYDLKVQGNNQKTLSGSVVIEIVNNASTVDLLWDYETNRTLSNKKPLGVAADGTARLLLKITPNATVASRVKKITAELQNPTNGAIINSSYLGKVMATNKTNSAYSDEASNVTSISASNIVAPTDNSYYFWYVAPDDFADKMIDDLVSGERNVKCKINLYDAANTFLNSVESTITVVRPPLALAHGLNGSSTDFNSLGYGSTTAPIIFKDDSRFKVKKSLTLYPSDAFEKNANVLLAKDNTKLDQSLAFLIDDMRIKGYACNRVDYVGHSMGGCVLRYATQLSDWKSNLNYNKGYVNKFITLDTPHQGSPFGDIVNEFTNQQFINKINKTTAFIMLLRHNSISSFLDYKAQDYGFIDILGATRAVQNLSLRESNGGIKLKESTIKNHEIIGDYVKNFNPTLTALGLNGDVSAYTIVGLPVLANALSDGALIKFKQCNCIGEYNAVQAIKERSSSAAFLYQDSYFTQEFLNWQAKRVANINNFFQNSDIIVGTESQAAGQLSQKLPSQTVVMASHSFGKSSVLASLQAGNKVYELLNAPINGNLFSNVIPATPIYTSVYSCGTTDCKNTNGRLAANEQTLDTTKIKIISPGRLSGTTFFAGTNQYIQVQLKDTTGFRFLELNFGLLRLRTADKKGVVSMFIQVPADIIGKQDLRVKGVYRDKNGNYQEYEDIISVTVQTSEQPQVLQILPTSLKLNVGQKDSLSIVATYAKTQSLLVAPFSNITAQWDNNSLSFDIKTMIITGKKVGKSQIVLILSNGKRYSVDVEVTQVILATEEPVLSSTISIFPNPTTNNFILNYQIEKLSDVKIELVDLQGKVLNTLLEGHQTASEYNLDIHISKYQAGVYLLRIQIGSQTITKKIIKI